MIWIVMILAGGLGAALRYVTDFLLRRRLSRGWPIAIINVVGTTVLGALAGAADSDQINHAVFSTLGALCGGFTTFSTAMLDAVEQAQEAHPAKSLALLIGVGVLASVGFAAGFVALS